MEIKLYFKLTPILADLAFHQLFTIRWFADHPQFQANEFFISGGEMPWRFAFSFHQHCAHSTSIKAWCILGLLHAARYGHASYGCGLTCTTAM